MATLQKLRNMGPLLVIFVGLALFAFIAGDAWRLFQSNTSMQNVGSIDGEELSAMDFQKMYEEYSNVVKFTRGTSSLTEDESNSIKDEVWETYVNSELIKREADKIGLTVTEAELQAIVNAGAHPLLHQTPFRNQQGVFDKDILNEFLAQYNLNKENPEFAEIYKPAYDYWKFIEKTIMQSLLMSKYQALIQNSFFGNPIVAKSNFEINNSTYDIEVAAYPYAALKGDEFTATEGEVKSLYNEKKSSYKEPVEKRSIKYVSYKVTPSALDREELKNELNEYADSLKAGNEEYAALVRIAGSEIPYSKLAWSKSAYPEEVQVRLDSVALNSVVGPIYSQSDDSYTVFKTISKTTLPDSVQYRMLAITADTAERLNELTDSLAKVLKSGANFKEVAKTYGQEGNDSLWITSANYDGIAIAEGNVALVDAILNGKKGAYAVIDMENQNTKVIYQVLASKNPVQKYNAVVLKRKAEFSKETYNDAYNKFSQYVASCKTLADLEKNAEEFGYRVMTQNNVTTATHKIANLNGTRDAVKWVFAAEKEDVSPLYECGESDYLLVAALSKIQEKGYTNIDVLKPSLTFEIQNNKKAEKIIADMKGKSFDQLKKEANIKTCETKRITFSAPAYISATAASEPAISAAASKMQVGEVSAPIKGNSAVYVIKVVAKNEKAGEFDAKSEENNIRMRGLRDSNRFLNDIVEKTEIEDNRYLFF